MYKITSQVEFEKFCQSDDPHSFNESLWDDSIILLEGDIFEFDSQSNIVNRFFTFKGIDQPTIIFKNFELGTTDRVLFNNPDEMEREINTFSQTYSITFKNCNITSVEFFELQFDSEDEINEWSDNEYDTNKIRAVNSEYEGDKILEYLDTYDLSDFKEGDHIVVDRGIYTHHGIYIGNNELIHYIWNLEYGGDIEVTSIENFAKDDTFWIYKHRNSFSREKIVERAYSKLGEDKYNLIFNNCEHFAHWCSTGERWSNQVGLGLALGRWINKRGKKYILY